MTLDKTLPTISVIIPVYFAEKTLPSLIPPLDAVLRRVSTAYEILLVNDGSQDRSWQVICELAEKYKAVRGINLMRNYGQHNAVLCGIREAKYDISITMDDDLQHDPESIPLLLAELDKGYDMIYGAPRHEQHGILRDLASIITKLTLSTVMNTKSARHVSALRIFRTSLRKAFEGYNGPSVSIDVLLSWGTTKISYIEVEHHERAEGTSHYTFKKLVLHALNMITGFSTLPLRLSTATGFILTIFGIGILFYVVIRYLIQGGSVPGFTFMTSVISIFSGAQLFTLGIIGEYLARMHFRLMDKPPYTVEQRTDDERE
jgi:undecaprenyl-phosphate 4-deoxy-4-formamido-L-arabinose transferase